MPYAVHWESVSQQSHWLSLWPPWWTSPRICDYKCGCVFVVWVVLGQPLQYLCQPLSAWSFCRQKVQADSLPHVVCLKCDPDEVIAMLRKVLTHKVKKDCISNNKKNKHTEQCLRLYLDLFRATQPSCIFKALERNKAGLDCSVRWAWCDWKKKSSRCPCLSRCSGVYIRQNGPGLQQAADAEWNHGNREGLGHVNDWTVSVLFYETITLSGCNYRRHVEDRHTQYRNALNLHYL